MFKFFYFAAMSMLAAALLTGCAGLKNIKQQNIKNEPVSRQDKKEQEFEQVVTVSRPIAGVPILVSYQGGAFYHVEVANTLPTVINLLWDESAYVNTRGESVRILHIAKKTDLPRDPPAQQASPPIAPNSRFQADFIGDIWLDAARSGATPQPNNSLRKARIYLSFNIKGKRVEWQGEIAFIPVKPH